MTTDAKEPESVRALQRIRELSADVDAWVAWSVDGALLEAYPGELLDHIATLTRERDDARQDASRLCQWREDDADFGTWRTGCGHLWSFNAGGPKENDTKFCQYCGGALDAARFIRTASRTRTESVESVMSRIRTGPSPITGFTKDGIQKMATAEADGYAFAGERQKTPHEPP